jgi:chromosome segregation ATPase
MGELPAAIAEMEALLKKLKAEVALHQKDRAAAKDAITVATEVEEKAAAEAKKDIVDNTVYINALKKAIAAIEKGVAGGFLQTEDARVLKRLVTAAEAKLDKIDADGRDMVLAFLSGQGQEDQGGDAPAYGNEYVPQSQEIVGMLKQMLDEMTESQKLEVGDDAKRISDFKLLVKAKLAEIAALTDLIESKLKRIGELSVKLVMMKEDLDDTREALGDNKSLLKDLDANCDKVKKEYELACKMRAEELVALADTIKVLNDDDALDLFKKTLPSLTQTSLLQTEVSQRELRSRALSAILAARHGGQRGLDLIALALRGKKVGFEKIITMIEELISTLKKEQTADDDKLEYCKISIDATEDKTKELGHKISDLENSIAKNTDAVIALKDEIDTLEDGIKEMDKEVAEATEQRKEEHEEYHNLKASDTAAKELLAFAKNRLNKFYNPKLYKPPPKRELTEEERITLNNGGTLAPTAAPGGIAGTGIGFFAQVAASAAASQAPPAPSAYKKKGESSGGVIHLIDTLISDLDKELTEAETTEKNSQEDYEQFMKDSAAKRAEDSKLLVDKKANLA